VTMTDTAVRASIVVEAPIDHAFKVFTEDLQSWWNPDHHILQTEVAEMVFEPRVGGHLYDVGVDGSECHWGRVLAFDPPGRVVFSWDIDMQWQVETDHDRTSEVEVRFTDEGDGRTRVDLEHRNLERHGQGWEQMRAAVDSDDGWPAELRGFAEAVRG
jgi:uncharacterized protein YndB with AHSA1/START domain